MAYANILDNILNEPRQGTKTASTLAADTLLDSGRTVQYARTGSAKVAGGEDSLAEAALKVASTTKRKALSIEAAIEVYKGTGGQDSKTASAAIHAAGKRLMRLAAKTPAQMTQDGATKLADYANPEIVPAWAKQVRADLTLFTNLASKKAKTASTEEILAERQMSDKEIAEYINKLLHEGHTPNEVDLKLKKLAELQGFNRQFATDKLRDEAGLVGYTFIEPNAFMEACPPTYERMQQKLGGIRAKSVKQIAACTGCQHFKQTAGAKRCNLYRLPIVATQSDLLPIINNLTPGINGAKAKKAALVAQHNREAERPVVGVKKASKEAAYTRNTADVAIRTSSTKERVKTASSFTTQDALRMHEAGQSVQTIYKQASQTVGAAEAKATLRKFIAGLKGTKTKVALTQIDCSLLKGKLATSNGIVGEKKCASCVYRRGMHCGLTGGTLLAFPGMDKVKPNHRVASGAPKDGHAMMREFEMTTSNKAPDIHIASAGQLEVELTSTSKVDL